MDFWKKKEWLPEIHGSEISIPNKKFEIFIAGAEIEYRTKVISQIELDVNRQQIQ